MSRSKTDIEPEFLNTDTIVNNIQKEPVRKKTAVGNFIASETISRKNIKKILEDHKKSTNLKKKLLKRMLNNYLDSRFNVDSEDELT